MADAETNNQHNDLDAFFSAASSANPEMLQKAAQNVAGPTPTAPESPSATSAQEQAAPSNWGSDLLFDDDSDILDDDDYDSEDLHGKFIAIDPSEAPGGTANAGNAPFILIPANIPSFLPWWGWLTIGLGLLVLVAGVLLMPEITLSRLASRLGDPNQANVQHAMRQLVVKGDERTVRKLYDMALSRQAAKPARLRAVDTLGLIRLPQADRALLHLELAGDTDEQIREAAIAARKQREAAKTRGRR